nr:RNA-directed DNA polymerase, eukaryota, reverse transcriptase zinc-binding domain protein [Tanacetum cinerariifolium]
MIAHLTASTKRVFIFSFIKGDRRSQEDGIHNIFTSIFVTNFPDETNAKELWRFDNQYGNVIEAFIPDRRSKIGKRFSFIRFIKVADVDRLINNLCTIWIGKFKLHANVARFNRLPLNKGIQHAAPTAKVRIPYVETFNRGGAHGTSNSYIQAFKTGSSSKAVVEESKSSMVLDHSCYNNFDSSLSFVGKLKEFGSLPNIKKILEEEGVAWIDIEGVPLCVWSRNTFDKISSKWGSLLHEEDEDDSYFHRKRLFIKTSIRDNIFESFKIIIKEDVNDDALSENGKEESHSEADIIPETVFEEGEVKSSDIKEKSNEVPSIGNSGGILCVWDTNMFQRENVTISDYFIAIMGDFNEVRFAEERFETIFNAHRATVFNSFITSGGLVEVPTGFDYFMADTWRSNNILESNAMLKLIKKLKLLKGCVRTWVHDKKERSHNLKKCLKNKLCDIDISLDKGEAISAMLDERFNIMNDLTSLENNVSLELAQKAKIKWAIKGDENSKNFHGIVNKYRNNLAVRGIIADGEWIEEPNAVKNEFFSHFRDRFDRPCKSRLTLDMEFPNKLSTDQSHYLERPFSMEEVKELYWSLIEDDVLEAVNYFSQYVYCHKGGNSSFIALILKIPGAKMVKDFRPISLIGSLYKIIAKLLANRLVTTMSDHVNEVQSAFIANRQILDGPFILNEIIHWGSILVNGSPTLDIQFYKGLKQSDPLSPFLFILVMESHNLSLHNVVFAGLFKGVNLDNSLQLYHPFYADDVVFSMVEVAASNIGCMALNLPFSYLEIIIASKEKGGLGVSSFYALNRALIFKWIWRFHTQGSSLWSRVIKLIHGEDGKIVKSFKHQRMSNWNNITRGITLLQNKGIDLLSYLKKKTGNGENTLFQGEVWKSDVPFSLLYPRIFALESCKFITVANKMAHSILAYSLRRNPRGGDGEFSVASVRNLVDDRTLAEVGAKTRWITYVPIKVNILAWRIKLNNLPSRLNLSRRGLDLYTIFCPSCNSVVQSNNHIFFGFPMVKDLYKFLARWWDVSMKTFFSYDEWWNWFSNLRVPSKLKLIFEGVFYISWWVIWNYRNKVIFGPGHQSKDRLTDDIVAFSFTLCRSRCKAKFSWIDWLKNHSLIPL